MELKNWLLLSFVYCFTFYSELAHGMSKRNIHNVIFKQNKDECVCFQENPHLSNIPQILDPDNKGIERLIIFVYRTEDGNIHAFIPNKNKQSLLPDLQYENEDAFTLIKNDKLVTIFSNSNRIIKYPHIGYDTDSFPIKKPINVGEIPGNIDEKEYFYNEYNGKPVPHNEPTITQLNYYDNNGKPVTKKLIKNYDVNYVKPNSSVKPIIAPLPLPPRSPTTNVLEASSSENLFPLGFNSENSQETENMTPKYIDFNNLAQNIVNKLQPLSSSMNKEPHLIKQNSQDLNKENQIELTHIIDGILPNSNNGQDLISSVVPVSKGTKPRTMSDETFNKWFVESFELRKSIKPINFSTLEHLIQAALKRQGMFVSPKGVLTDAQGNILNMTDLHLRPLLIGDLLEYTKVKENPNSTYTFPENLPYMEALLIAVLHPPKIIGIIPLKKLHPSKTLDINNVLNEHMKHIKDASSLQNNQNDKSMLLEHESFSRNMAPNYANDRKDLKSAKTLKILSNKKPTKQSFKTKVEIPNKTKFASNEDISHKIKSYVTHKDHILHNTHSGISKAKHDLPKFSKDIKMPDPHLSQGSVHSLLELLHKIENEHKNKYGSLKVDKKEKNKELGFARRKQISRVQDPVLSSNDLVHKNNVSAGNTQKEEEDLREKISEIVLPLLQKFKTRASGYMPTPLNNKNGTVIVKNEDGDDFDPDFRIIGGSAATGSGRPISNRGRSGNIFPIE